MIELSTRARKSARGALRSPERSLDMSPPIIFLLLVIAAVFYFRNKKKAQRAAAQPKPQAKPAAAPATSGPTDLSDWIFSFNEIPEETLSEIEENDNVELVPEPDNPKDPRAIQVMYDDVQLGYLFKGYLYNTVHRALDKGAGIDAFINRIDRNPKDPKKFIEITVEFDWE